MSFEQPSELAVVGCDDGRSRSEPLVQLRRQPLERGQRIRVEHQTPPRLSRHRDHGAGRGGDSQGRADDKRIQSLIRENGMETFRALATPQHDGGELSRIDAERLRRRRYGDKSGADPQSRPRCQPGRPCAGGAAGGDQHMPPIIFVRREFRARNGSSP